MEGSKIWFNVLLGPVQEKIIANIYLRLSDTENWTFGFQMVNFCWN
jgi:hypothetical protein